jgi:hypothetical protein
MHDHSTQAIAVTCHPPPETGRHMVGCDKPAEQMRRRDVCDDGALRGDLVSFACPDRNRPAVLHSDGRYLFASSDRPAVSFEDFSQSCAQFARASGGHHSAPPVSGHCGDHGKGGAASRIGRKIEMKSPGREEPFQLGRAEMPICKGARGLKKQAAEAQCIERRRSQKVSQLTGHFARGQFHEL